MEILSITLEKDNLHQQLAVAVHSFSLRLASACLASSHQMRVSPVGMPDTC